MSLANTPLPLANPPDRKPVNINISFNISRKQVTHNINSTQQQKTGPIHSLNDDDPTPGLKPKNTFHRQPKTPELSYTDRTHNYNHNNKDLVEYEYQRPTEELKRRRKKVKRSSVGDCTFAGDRTMNLLPSYCYNQNELQKSISGHRRGHTTSFTRKSNSQTVAMTNNKKKKPSTKNDDTLFLKANRTVILNQPSTTHNNPSKSLKGIINKMINSELSKRSLPLSGAPINKSKYNKAGSSNSQSVSLTARKVTSTGQKTGTGKKRASKSQMMTKDSQMITKDKSLYRKQYSDPIIEQQQSPTRSQFNLQPIINNPHLLQKLTQFRSIQNSLLILQAQHLQQQQASQATGPRKNPRIVIKTDQSIECIEEIHLFERERLKEGFFDCYEEGESGGQGQGEDEEEEYGQKQERGVKRGEKQRGRSSDTTGHLLQAYIELLRQSNNQLYYQEEEQHNQANQPTPRSKPTHRPSQPQSTLLSPGILQNRHQIIYDQNYLNSSDLQKVDDLLMSPSNSYVRKEEISGKRHKGDNVVEIEEARDHRMEQSEDVISIPSQHIPINQQQQSIHKNTQQNVPQPHQLNDLLEYIKSSMGKDTPTSEVLQNVYGYLQKAKGEIVEGEKESAARDDGVDGMLREQFDGQQEEEEQHSHSEEEEQQQIQPQHSHSLQQQILEQQTRSFHSSYHSQQTDSNPDSQINFMSLQTIESALKNRLRLLNEKKEKQLNKLEQSYQDNRIGESYFIEQKELTEKWFRREIEEIMAVKRNIWKGYMGAKGVLGKGGVEGEGEKGWKGEEIERKGDKKIASLEKSNEKNIKNKKMMKCLSESYLKNKINYKQIDQTKQNRTQQKPGKHLRKLKKQKYVGSDEDQDYHQKPSHIQQKHKPQQSSINQQPSSLNQPLASTSAPDIEEDRVIDPEEEADNIDEKINQKSGLDRLREDAYNAKLNVDQTTQQQFSPTMVQYEEIPKQLVSSSLSSEGEGSEQSFNYYYPSSSQSSSQYPYQYDQHQNSPSPSSTKYHPQQQPQQQPQLSCIIPSTLPSTFHPPPTSPLTTPPTSPPPKPLSPFHQSLAHLTPDDRQDIFQFLFLDLCIELYHEPCHNNTLMTTVSKFITKQLQMGKRKKGFKTNLNVVKDYLKRFCGYILRTNKGMLSNVNVPMGPTAVEMLRYMHENDAAIEDDEPIQEGEGAVTLIVPISVFDTFERSLMPTLWFERYYDNDDKEKQRVNFLKNVMHIHNKAMFDALNEYLDQERPFGIWGKPFPWKKSSSFTHEFTQHEHEEKLKKSAQKVVEACSYVCGLLADKQQSLIGNARVSQAYIEQIRQDRISRMLANDMIENEERWVFYDDEETEVLVEIANSVVSRLLVEVVGEWAVVRKGRVGVQEQEQ